MRLVLFDVDGTLVDSQAAIHACMDATFAAFGHEAPPPAAVKGVIGLSLDRAIERLLDGRDGDPSAMSVSYKDRWPGMQGRPDLQVRFFDGMRNLLDVLAAREDLILGVVTGKSRRGVAHLVESHGLEHHFLTRRTADDCPSKPHPAMVRECCDETGIAPAQTVVVGDTTYDMAMARAAGAGAIGVGWGYHEGAALRRAGASMVVETAKELAECLCVDELPLESQD
ncbi:MAG: HAD-IA family hydrolase [Pseudomonadota bacterium]|nr:HAD-IA family hydrolase [Pseudomonadota bacterium]